MACTQMVFRWLVKVLLEKYSADTYFNELGLTVGDALLAIHRSYKQSIYPLLQSSIGKYIHALSHITGGGIEGNTKRVVPKGLKLSIDWDKWQRPAIFNLIKSIGDVPEEDMRRTFNLGIGLIMIVDRKGVDSIIDALKRMRENSFVIGEIIK